MKTTNTITRKIKSATAGLTFFMCGALLITACQKEDMQQPSYTTVAASENQRLIDQVLPIDLLAFSLIKIDHLSARSFMPDYCVTVSADGIASFEGRRNVGVLKTVKFKLTKDQLSAINELCLQTNFFKIEDLDLNIPDMPIVTTTFSNSEQKAMNSDSGGVPAELVSFRTQIEKLLNISKFVNGRPGIQLSMDTK